MGLPMIDMNTFIDLTLKYIFKVTHMEKLDRYGTEKDIE